MKILMSPRAEDLSALQKLLTRAIDFVQVWPCQVGELSVEYGHPASLVRVKCRDGYFVDLFVDESRVLRLQDVPCIAASSTDKATIMTEEPSETPFAGVPQSIALLWMIEPYSGSDDIFQEGDSVEYVAGLMIVGEAGTIVLGRSKAAICLDFTFYGLGALPNVRKYAKMSYLR
jgi:hypothetical protein